MNRSTETTAPDNTARIARAAWLCAFVVPLVLAMLLLTVSSAQAASPFPAIAPLAFEEEEPEEGLEEEVEGEFAEAECEIAEEEFAEGLLTETDVKELCSEAEEATGGGANAATECPIRSARARAVENHDRLKVTVGYTSSAPTKATIELRSGNKRLATIRRKLGRSGVLRIVKKLGKKDPSRIVVRIKAPSCAKFQTKPARVG
ncbi:MAG: hypothetical protein WDZ46_07445 [Solirubrobacterales bacterium]